MCWQLWPPLQALKKGMRKIRGEKASRCSCATGRQSFDANCRGKEVIGTAFRGSVSGFDRHGLAMALQRAVARCAVAGQGHLGMLFMRTPDTATSPSLCDHLAATALADVAAQQVAAARRRTQRRPGRR
jgi:hypothetical protein